MKTLAYVAARLRLAAIIAFTTLVAFDGSSKTNSGSLDLTFDPTAGGTLVGLTGGSPIVHAVLPQPDGKVLIGGWFNGVNGTRRNNIARLNSDGSPDPTFQPGFGTDGTVSGLALQADGKVIVIGEYQGFRTVNAQLRPRIARLNADGSVDETFNCLLAGDANLRLTGVAVQESGKIWIGGQFTNVNGVARLNLARLNADGSLDTSFDPQAAIPGTNRYVDALKLQPDGKLLVAGAWGAPTRSLIRLNVDGTLDSGFAHVVVADPWEFYGLGSIRDIACNSNGVIAIAGYFSAVNGVAVRHHVARLHPNGTVDTGFVPAEPDYNFLWAVAIQPDGKVIVGGNFNAMNGVAREGIARLNTNGTVDASFDPANAPGVPTGFYAGIRSLMLQSDGRLLVAADAWWDQGDTNSVFRLSNTGQRETEFTTLLSARPDGVSLLALQSDDKAIISMSGSYTRSALARLNTNGLMDETFVPGTNFNFTYANAAVVQPDGKILVVTDLQERGQAATVIRLLADGRVDTNFHAPIVDGGEAPIETLALQPDGRILVGGLIWDVEGHPHKGIVRLHSDGSFDPSFKPVPVGVTDDPGYGVEQIFVLSGGDILITGGFTWQTGEPAGIARLRNDGTVDEDFASNVTSHAASSVHAALQPDGKIILTGSFPGLGFGVIRLNADGTDDLTFQRALDREFHSPVVQPDGQILLATGWPDWPDKGRIIRLHPDGSTDPTFQAEFRPWGAGRILLQPNGQVLVSGGFYDVNGIPMHGIVRLNNDVRWRVTVAPQTIAGQFRLMIAGWPGARLIIECSSDLHTWTELGEVTTGTTAVPFVDSEAAQFPQRFYRTREAE